MDLIEWILVSAIKRAAGACEQIGYAQTDDDRHQRGDKLEAAHEILRVLHGAPSLTGIEPENRVANGWLRGAHGSRHAASAHKVNLSWLTTSPAHYSNRPEQCLRSDRCDKRQAVRLPAFPRHKQRPRGDGNAARLFHLVLPARRSQAHESLSHLQCCRDPSESVTQQDPPAAIDSTSQTDAGSFRATAEDFAELVRQSRKAGTPLPAAPR